MPDDLIERLLLELADHFNELDDSDDGPFGNFARVSVGHTFITVFHETEEWGVEITVKRVSR